MQRRLMVQMIYNNL